MLPTSNDRVAINGSVRVQETVSAKDIRVTGQPDWYVGANKAGGAGNVVLMHPDGKVLATNGHLRLDAKQYIVAHKPLTFAAGAGVRGVNATSGQVITCAACSASAQVIITPTRAPSPQWYVQKNAGSFRVIAVSGSFTFDWLVIP